VVLPFKVGEFAATGLPVPVVPVKPGAAADPVKFPKAELALAVAAPVPPFATATGVDKLTVTFPLDPPPDSPVPADTPVTVPAPGVCHAPSAPQNCPVVPPEGQVTTWLFALLELVHGVPPFSATELNAAPLLADDPHPRSFST
jgi:hypothetical protein